MTDPMASYKKYTPLRDRSNSPNRSSLRKAQMSAPMQSRFTNRRVTQQPEMTGTMMAQPVPRGMPIDRPMVQAEGQITDP